MTIRHVRNYILEKFILEIAGKFGFIPHGMVRDVAIITTLSSIPSGVYGRAFIGLQHLVGAPLSRIHSPNVMSGSARVSDPGLRTASVRNYGVRRIGGRMLGTTFGALMMAEAMLPSMRQFLPEQTID